MIPFILPLKWFWIRTKFVVTLASLYQKRSNMNLLLNTLKIYIVLLPLFFFIMFPRQSISKERQIWHTDTISIPFGNSTTLIGQTELRYKKNLKTLYKHYQGQLNLHIPYIDVACGYRHIYCRKNQGWVVKYHSLLDITFQFNLLQCSISNRFRIIYRISKTKLHKWDRYSYSNLLELIMPIHFMGHNIKPYISDELFLKKQIINQNRGILGLRMTYHTRTQLDLYYMLRLFKISHNTWGKQIIYGISFSLRF